MTLRNVDITKRTYLFALRIFRLVNSLPNTIGGQVIGKQILRLGTAIGANVEEAQNSSSKKEFTHIMTISLKEARETEYWLRIIDGNFVKREKLALLLQENKEIIKILTAIIKNTKAH